MSQFPSPNDSQEGCCFIALLALGLLIIGFALAVLLAVAGLQL